MCKCLFCWTTCKADIGLSVFVTCLVIIVVSSWALSNRICFHMISSHMMTWDTFGSCQQYCSCCPEKNCVFFFAIPTVVFCRGYGKTTMININAVGLHLRRSSSNRNNVKLVQVVIQAQNHWILSYHLVQLSAGRSLSVQCKLFIKLEKKEEKKKSRYRNTSCVWLYCKLNHIGAFSALASWTELED